MTKKTIALGDMLTHEQMQQAIKLYHNQRNGLVTGSFAKAALVQLFTPATMARINRKTQQENDPLYLAYALEHADPAAYQGQRGSESL